jgi:ribosome-binding protein aMBF1 (putative translation factor)
MSRQYEVMDNAELNSRQRDADTHTEELMSRFGALCADVALYLRDADAVIASFDAQELALETALETITQNNAVEDPGTPFEKSLTLSKHLTKQSTTMSQFLFRDFVEGEDPDDPDGYGGAGNGSPSGRARGARWGAEKDEKRSSIQQIQHQLTRGKSLVKASNKPSEIVETLLEMVKALTTRMKDAREAEGLVSADLAEQVPEAHELAQELLDEMQDKESWRERDSALRYLQESGGKLVRKANGDSVGSDGELFPSFRKERRFARVATLVNVARNATTEQKGPSWAVVV